MISRRTCFDEFCLLLFVFISLPGGILFCLADNSCDGNCKPLGECEYWADREYIPYDKLPYCDKKDLLVCCPTPRTHTVVSVDYTIPYIADCNKWKQQIYENCPTQGLIVDGDDAGPKEFPHMALLGTLKDKKMDWFCGGSLISPKFVVTAEHCVDLGDVEITVRLGELDYSRTDDDDNIQDFKVVDTIYYPEPSDDKNTDIALVELDGIAQINSYVVPICLPMSNGSEYNRLYAAGWGFVGQAKHKSPLLQKVKLERFADKRCKSSTGEKDNRTQICCGSTNSHRDTCQGDSGGPLFIESKIFACMYEVQGIVSEGAGCGIMNAPGFYTRVLYFVDWIQSQVWNTTNANEQKKE